MEKKIEDYLHLYLGCEMERGGIVTGALLQAAKEAAFNAWLDFKPILRPLSDMTEEEAADVYTIERDRILHTPTIDHDLSKRIDFGWVVTRLDHMNIGLLIRFDGVCYKVVDEGKRPTIEPAMNQPLIFHYLLSKRFDLFNLIPDGLAIDKTTLK